MKVRTRGCCGEASYLNVQDEGEDLGAVTTMNFVGEAVTVEKNGNTATVSITASSSGGGGGAPLTDHNISDGAPTGTIAIGARYYLLGSPGTILGEEVAEGTTMEARIANPTIRADWYFNFGGT